MWEILHQISYHEKAVLEGRRNNPNFSVMIYLSVGCRQVLGRCHRTPIKHRVTEQMDNNNWLQQLLMVGVGTTSVVADKLRTVSDEWVKEGKINPEQAKGIVDEMMQQIKSEHGNLEAQMERQLRNMMQDLGVPRQSEVDELRGRIDRLERQVRDLENKLWR
jgi:polyhydroxyalkanoate synthesis regulator phasin